MSKLDELLRELCPDGVEYVKLNSVCDIYDGTHSTPNYTESGVKFASVENIDLAENRARRHIPMTMEDWAKRLDIYLQADDLEVLKDAGTISAQLAKMHAETEFEKYRVVQDRLYQSDFDRYLEENLE